MRTSGACWRVANRGYVLNVAAIVCLSSGGVARGQTLPIGIATPVTYSDNYDPSLSPDGTHMVFLKALEGREQLFIADADGSGERRLLGPVGVDIEDPAWSPDGRQIAYIRIRGPSKTMHVMNADGGSDRVMTPPSQSPIHPAWMPDGRSIFYCTDDDLHPPQKNAAEIYRLDVASGKITTVISGGVNTYPVPSPDGMHIAFRRMIDTNSEIFVANIDGTDTRNLTNHPAFDGWPAWSPDGRRIAFASNRNSAYQVFVMDADGSNVQLVANTEGRATAPQWSKDGRSIYFTNSWRTGLRGASEIFRAPVP
jgi:TolB protein